MNKFYKVSPPDAETKFDISPENTRIRIPIISNVPMQLEINTEERGDDQISLHILMGSSHEPFRLMTNLTIMEIRDWSLTVRT